MRFGCVQFQFTGMNWALSLLIDIPIVACPPQHTHVCDVLTFLLLAELCCPTTIDVYFSLIYALPSLGRSIP